MEKTKRKIVILFSIASFFVVFFGISLGILVGATINTKNTEQFTSFDTSLPTKLLDINGEFITEFSGNEKREIVSLTKLPQTMIAALISREDNIFYEHPGFSLKAIFRAVVGKLTGLNLGGGSTLTQQIGGTLYCDRTEISISRKIKELWWAIQMERRFSKNEILELYINKVYFGGGTNGVGAASKYYFGHSATEITPAEAAILVIQLSNPAYYNPFEHPNIAMERQKYVLDYMVNLKYLTQEEADESFDEYWANFDYTRTNTSAYAMREDPTPWFSEYVRRELLKKLYGNTNIYTDGYTVNTTLNMSHQLAAQKTMKKWIDYANRSYLNSSEARSSDASKTYIPMTELMSLVFNIPDLKVSEQRNELTSKTYYKEVLNPVVDMMTLMFGVENLKVGVVNRLNSEVVDESAKTTIEGTMISLENNTGYITALIGGSKFSETNQLIRCTQGLMQPGSSIKPLYYSAAIDSRKFTETSIIYDTPIVFHTESGDPYIPLDFEGVWKGPVQLWYALAHSMNVPSLKILDAIGFDVAIDRMTNLYNIPEDEIDDRAFVPGYPIGLGTCAIHPIEAAQAFAVFANEGKRVTPIAIRSIEDKKGTIILNPEKELRQKEQDLGNDIQVISPQTAYIMTDLLQNTVKTGSLAWGSGWGTKFRYKDENGNRFTMPAGGKTGTTQNWEAAWAVGFTPYYTSAFWFGFDQTGQSLGLQLTGSTLAGQAWGDFMSAANEGLPYKEFKKPTTGIVEATVCSVSGQILTDACGDNRIDGIYLTGTQPDTICELHSNRITAAQIGAQRLEYEKFLTGTILNPDIDNTPLTVDLSFLKQDIISNKNEISSENTEDSETSDSSKNLDDSENTITADNETTKELQEAKKPLINNLLD
ncbi:MAG: penicillin-binding protein [Treponema sp. CETP13]|nr:MAG: penicillin-binding protein [Treponema sp. CETP13]